MKVYIIIASNREDDNDYDYETSMAVCTAQSKEQAIDLFFLWNVGYPFILSCEAYNPEVETLY
jgi:elongation factor P hydroxylase